MSTHAKFSTTLLPRNGLEAMRILMNTTMRDVNDGDRDHLEFEHPMTAKIGEHNNLLVIVDGENVEFIDSDIDFACPVIFTLS